MKYITRDLYEVMQPRNPAPDGFSERAWLSATRAKQEYEKELLARMPQGVINLRESSMHDGIITAVETKDDAVMIEIDGRDLAWHTAGQYRLVFRGVQSVSGIEEIVDDFWLYEEIDLHPQAAFELRVLLEDSEFQIAANDVELIQVAQYDYEEDGGDVSIGLLVIRSAKIEEVVDFYEKIGMKFKKHRTGPRSEYYSTQFMDGSIFEIRSETAKSGSSMGAQLGFMVVSLDELFEKLELPDSRVISRPANSKKGRRAVVLDPDGHRVELRGYGFVQPESPA